jgi:hypothetical protein
MEHRTVGREVRHRRWDDLRSGEKAALFLSHEVVAGAISERRAIHILTDVLVVDGRTWEELRPVEKARLINEDAALAAALRQDFDDRSKNGVAQQRIVVGALSGTTIRLDDAFEHLHPRVAAGSKDAKPGTFREKDENESPAFSRHVARQRNEQPRKSSDVQSPVPEARLTLRQKANLPRIEDVGVSISEQSPKVQAALDGKWPPSEQVRKLMRAIRARESDAAGGPNARPLVLNKKTKKLVPGGARGRYQVIPKYFEKQIQEKLGWETSDWFDENATDGARRRLMAERQDIVFAAVVLPEQLKGFKNLKETRLGKLLSDEELFAIAGYGPGHLQEFLDTGVDPTQKPGMPENKLIIDALREFNNSEGRKQNVAFEREYAKLTGSK